MAYFSKETSIKKSMDWRNMKKVEGMKKRATSSEQFGAKKTKTLYSQSTN